VFHDGADSLQGTGRLVADRATVGGKRVSMLDTLAPGPDSDNETAFAELKPSVPE
jgi:hypothetical protein